MSEKPNMMTGTSCPMCGAGEALYVEATALFLYDSDGFGQHDGPSIAPKAKCMCHLCGWVGKWEATSESRRTQRNYTVWCRQSNGEGTIYISNPIRAYDIDSAVLRGLVDCRRAWESGDYSSDGEVVCIGAAYSDRQRIEVEWNDSDEHGLLTLPPVELPMYVRDLLIDKAKESDCACVAYYETDADDVTELVVEIEALALDHTETKQTVQRGVAVCSCEGNILPATS